MNSMQGEREPVSLSVNGKPRMLHAGATVEELLGILSMVPAQVVVEHNGKPIERELFGVTHLREGDRIEIAQMVGGG